MGGHGPGDTVGVGSGGQVTVGSYEWDLATDVWVWSPELFAIHGLDPASTTPSTESLLGPKHDADRAYAVEVMAEAQRTGESFSYLHRIVRPDGVLRTVLTVGQVEFDVAGEPVVMRGHIVDLTELPVLERVRELQVENQWLHDELAQTRNALAELHGQWRAGTSAPSPSASPGRARLQPVDDE